MQSETLSCVDDKEDFFFTDGRGLRHKYFKDYKDYLGRWGNVKKPRTCTVPSVKDPICLTWWPWSSPTGSSSNSAVGYEKHHHKHLGWRSYCINRQRLEHLYLSSDQVFWSQTSLTSLLTVTWPQTIVNQFLLPLNQNRHPPFYPIYSCYLLVAKHASVPLGHNQRNKFLSMCEESRRISEGPSPTVCRLTTLFYLHILTKTTPEQHGSVWRENPDHVFLLLFSEAWRTDRLLWNVENGSLNHFKTGLKFVTNNFSY